MKAFSTSGAVAAAVLTLASPAAAQNPSCVGQLASSVGPTGELGTTVSGEAKNPPFGASNFGELISGFARANRDVCF